MANGRRQKHICRQALLPGAKQFRFELAQSEDKKILVEMEYPIAAEVLMESVKALVTMQLTVVVVVVVVVIAIQSYICRHALSSSVRSHERSTAAHQLDVEVASNQK